MNTEATVNLLTAEVRTLMIGARQVTLTVWKQLDHASPEHIIPFGRVSPGRDYIGDAFVNNGSRVWIVGKHSVSGALVRSSLPLTVLGRADFLDRNQNWTLQQLQEKTAQWQDLDLIVLAGLR